MLLESIIWKHKNDEIDLENELLERSSTITLEDIWGNEPLNWFELKSITEEVDKIEIGRASCRERVSSKV